MPNNIIQCEIVSKKCKQVSTTSTNAVERNENEMKEEVWVNLNFLQAFFFSYCKIQDIESSSYRIIIRKRLQ